MFDHHYSTRKYLRGRTEEEIINLILGSPSGQDVTYEIIPKETEESSMP
jgi:hypothetical protein